MTTWTALAGAAGGAGPALPLGSEQDITTGLLAARGKVVDYCTFAGGSLQGWAAQHWDYYSPVLGISTTTRISLDGHCLYMPLADRPVTPTTNGEKKLQGSWGTALKRLVNYHPHGLKSFSAFIATGSGGNANEPAWAAWTFGMDIQRADNSTRGFFKAVHKYDEATGATVWYVSSDSGRLIKIPGSESAYTGENENKLNLDYVRLTIDEDANNGTGGYYELQVGAKLFDLRGLGAGRGKQEPQAGDWLADYRGGCNPLIAMDQRSVGKAAPSQPWTDRVDTPALYVARTLITYNDRRA